MSDKDNRYYYYVILSSEDGKIFHLTHGYQLPNGLAINRNYYGDKFIITDVKTGTKVHDKNFDSQKEALAEVQSEHFQKLLKEARENPSYERRVELLKEHINSIPVEDRCPGWKRYFK